MAATRLDDDVGRALEMEEELLQVSESPREKYD